MNVVLPGFGLGVSRWQIKVSPALVVRRPEVFREFSVDGEGHRFVDPAAGKAVLEAMVGNATGFFLSVIGRAGYNRGHFWAVAGWSRGGLGRVWLPATWGVLYAGVWAAMALDHGRRSVRCFRLSIATARMMTRPLISSWVKNWTFIRISPVLRTPRMIEPMRVP